jgi:hypothetical protein
MKKERVKVLWSVHSDDICDLCDVVGKCPLLYWKCEHDDSGVITIICLDCVKELSNLGVGE